MSRIRIGVIGGGASGMASAIAAARNGASVTIMERNDRVGRKILMTGNGKCNFSNTDLSTHMYYSDDIDFVRRSLDRFGVKEVVRFFQSLGLMIKEENGYYYPACEQASTVLDVLRFELDRLGVRVITGFFVNEIRHNGHFYTVLTENGALSMEFDRVIIACGGCAAPKTGSDGNGFELAKKLGHKIMDPHPALVQLRCKEDFFKSIAGVRADAKISVERGKRVILSEYGELQITDYGISGIPVFQISRVVSGYLKEQDWLKVHIDFLPGFDEAAYQEFMQVRKMLYGTGTVEEFFTGMLHKKLMQLFIRLAGLKGGAAYEAADQAGIDEVFRLCRDLEVTVTGCNSFDMAQATAGGVLLSEVTERFESRRMPGVYLVGELLDVDGKCGGYNLHWAWCSGILAGESAAEVNKGKRSF